ncbi:hypothetical protein CN367_11715 [Priestia megaterium]|uniref:phage protein Gp36 family protein n=1 Tax=Priestia megaterium TaxID=1404 RepID=UPI000BF880C5|nr:phage protein Gp36 family protein [Priestia megaterium]PEZ47028.1 hypothetical protein CN367_11715 [Priestia megaterium]
MYTSPATIRIVMRKLPPSITDQEINYFILKADALINGMLGEMFEIPFLIIPQLIQDISTDLAIYFLAESVYSSQKPNLDEVYTKMYDRAMGYLQKIIDGDITLKLPSGVPVEQKSTAGFASTNDQQIFNYEDPEW